MKATTTTTSTTAPARPELGSSTGTASTSANTNAAIRTILTTHPLHSRTEYLAYDRAHCSTQTTESDFPEVKRLCARVAELQADVDRIKLSLKAQYELEINERVSG